MSRAPRIFDDGPPEPPPERLLPGQPGKSWRAIGFGIWAVKCRDGSTCLLLTTGRAVFLKAA